jgi:hypothetical protein
MIGAPKRFGSSGARFKSIFEEWSQGNDDPNSPHCGFTWTADGLLSPQFLETARATMDEKDYQEQFHGSFATVSGGVYHAFGIDNIVTETKFINAPVYVACDFNVSPMCWVVMQEQDGFLTAVTEIVIRETNTYETSRRLKRVVPSSLEIQFYGDASGRARKTSAIASDWDIIMQEVPGAQILVPKSNPPVERRVASVNAAFRNGKLKIDARCKTLIKDLETLAYKPGSPIFDLRDPNIGHISDALGYLVYTRMPLRVDFPPQEQRHFIVDKDLDGRRQTADGRRVGVTSSVKGVAIIKR